MSRKVNIWEIAENIEAYENLETLPGWASSLERLGREMQRDRYDVGITIHKSLLRLLDMIKTELELALPESQLILPDEMDVDLTIFKLADFEDNLRASTMTFIFDLTWAGEASDKITKYLVKLNKTKSKILQPAQPSPQKRSIVGGGGLWGGFDIDSVLGSLCASTSGSTPGIPQSITLQGTTHSQTISSADGSGEYTVQIKMYRTSDIINTDKMDWWKNALTNMQFTMNSDDPEFQTLADFTLQATNRLKTEDNFRAEKKRRIMKK